MHSFQSWLGLPIRTTPRPLSTWPMFGLRGETQVWPLNFFSVCFLKNLIDVPGLCQKHLTQILIVFVKNTVSILLILDCNKKPTEFSDRTWREQKRQGSFTQWRWTMMLLAWKRSTISAFATRNSDSMRKHWKYSSSCKPSWEIMHKYSTRWSSPTHLGMFVVFQADFWFVIKQRDKIVLLTLVSCL